jgi:hypothetical protein
MGQARRKQYSRQEFLQLHPYCCYCGAQATTTDHCPPRCLFENRVWPETFEFPCCGPCNSESRLDEQAVAAIAISQRMANSGTPKSNEMLRGVMNNSPDLVAEWTKNNRRMDQRKALAAYGERGEAMRQAGWGTINLGPISNTKCPRG